MPLTKWLGAVVINPLKVTHFAGFSSGGRQSEGSSGQAQLLSELPLGLGLRAGWKMSEVPSPKQGSTASWPQHQFSPIFRLVSQIYVWFSPPGLNAGTILCLIQHTWVLSKCEVVFHQIRSLGRPHRTTSKRSHVEWWPARPRNLALKILCFMGQRNYQIWGFP